MSLHMARALETLSTLTLGNSERARRSKRQFVLILQERELLPLTILRENWTVYTCSHIDVRLPLLIGSRKIELVDPCFRDLNCVMTVIDIIERITDQRVTATLQGMKFNFDFGNGPEPVEVRCKAQVYQPNAAGGKVPSPWKAEMMQTVQGNSSRRFADHQGLPSYSANEPIGILLGFANYGITFDSNQQVTGRLVKGGFIIALPGPYEELDLSQEQFATLGLLSKPIWEEAVTNLYQEEGRYDFISLGSTFEDDALYSFLRKR